MTACESYSPGQQIGTAAFALDAQGDVVIWIVICEGGLDTIELTSVDPEVTPGPGNEQPQFDEDGSWTREEPLGAGVHEFDPQDPGPGWTEDGPSKFPAEGLGYVVDGFGKDAEGEPNGLSGLTTAGSDLRSLRPGEATKNGELRDLDAFTDPECLEDR